MRVLPAAAMVVTGLILACTGAFATEGDKEIEETLNYGTESFDGLGGQFGALAELHEIVERRFQLGEAAIFLTTVVLDADAGVETCLSVVVERQSRVAGDEPVDRR